MRVGDSVLEIIAKRFFHKTGNKLLEVNSHEPLNAPSFLKTVNCACETENWSTLDADY